MAETTYRVACPACGATLTARPEWAGRTAKCSRCQKSLVIPPAPVAPASSVAPAPPPGPGTPPAPRAPGGALNVDALRLPSESALRTVCLIVAILVYLALLVSIVGIIYLGIGVLVSYIALAVHMCGIRGNGIKAGPDQLPNVYDSARRAAQALGLAEVPDVYVIQAGGVLNAFATKWAFRRYVVLYSDLVDACGDHSAELDMIMAHEMGHLALGHITWHWILLPAMLVPFLSQAYSRACEYSCDRCGWTVCRDKVAASRGLLILAAGGNCARLASLEAFLRQRAEVEGFWQTVVEWLSTHPWLTRRVEALSGPAPAPAQG